MARISACLIAMALLALVPPATASEHEVERLILTPDPGTIFTIEGHYPQEGEQCEHKRRKPLRAKYRGRLTLELSDDGTIRMINSLTFDHYLNGLAEVPASWPAAALRAQVIAARSYALHGVRRDRALARERGYDICSTDQCQVYRGATIELGAFGDRWVRAVQRTRGQVLTYGDSVIQAFYFSTSDGRTRRSFPGGTPQPWLPSVDGHDEDAPLSRWTARIRLADLGRILDRSEDWPGGRIEDVRVSDEDIVIQGQGRRRSIPLTRFRIAMNNEAPCVSPERYPAPTGSSIGKRLPQTIPSTSFTIEESGDVLVVRGRGWGHFVGMSQWGANALAERGRSERQILKHFYGPASISRVDEPSRIRVLAADGMRVVRIAIDGEATVRTGTGSRLRAADAFEIRGGDALSILRGKGPSLAPVLRVTPVTSRVTGSPADVVGVRIESSRPVRARAEILQGRAVVARTRERSLESGKRTIRLRLNDADGAPLPPGEYDVVVEAFDGLDRVRTQAIALSVASPASATPAAAPPASTAPDTPLSRSIPLAIAVTALAAAGVLVLRSRLSRR